MPHHIESYVRLVFDLILGSFQVGMGTETCFYPQLHSSISYCLSSLDFLNASRVLRFATAINSLWDLTACLNPRHAQ